MPKDLQQAIKLFRQAAGKGDGVAQSNLGRLYAEGMGVAKDEKEAVKWFKKAAEKVT